MFTKLARKEEGFTLIELLVVVAIIALLTAFAVPRLFDAINKSKGSRGQADVETISGALERYYMDKNGYPTTADVATNLRGEYLKAGTSYLNGFNRKYIYVGGTGFYLLVDPKNQPNAQVVTITCNGHTATGTVEEVTSGVNSAPTAGTNSNIAKDDVKAGCTAAGSTSADTPVVVTN